MAISRSAGDAVSMSVRATGGREGEESVRRLKLPLTLEFLRSAIFRLENCQYGDWEECFVAAKGWQGLNIVNLTQIFSKYNSTTRRI